MGLRVRVGTRQVHSRSLGQRRRGSVWRDRNSGTMEGRRPHPSSPPCGEQWARGCYQLWTPASSCFYSCLWMAEVAPLPPPTPGQGSLWGQRGWELGSRRSQVAGGGPGRRFLAGDREPRVEQSQRGGVRSASDCTLTRVSPVLSGEENVRRVSNGTSKCRAPSRRLMRPALPAILSLDHVRRTQHFPWV